MRPNLHMQDMVDLYCLMLKLDDKLIAGRIYNAGYQNNSVTDIATIVRDVVAAQMPERGKVEMITTPSDDPRSYRMNCDRIKKELGFVPKYTIENGARDLVKAFKAGKLPNSMTDNRYFNIKRMKEIYQTAFSMGPGEAGGKSSVAVGA
jgi:nucleoside-diphosphate-sugar epimerase